MYLKIHVFEAETADASPSSPNLSRTETPAALALPLDLHHFYWHCM